MKGIVKKSIIFLIGFFMIFSLFYASEKGSLRIKLVMQEGSGVPGALVTISSPVMMGIKTLISDENGELLFANLTPGIYQVNTTLSGFKTLVKKDIRVSLNEEKYLPLQMELATIKETITITGEAPEIDAKKSAVSEYVTKEIVEALPIARDYVGYLQLATGVNIVPNSGGRDTPEDPAGKGGSNYRDRGDQGVSNRKRGTRDNLYFLDGMNITGLASQVADTSFNNEVIQEQELMTSGVPAEYGGGKGVVGNVVSKSGGNLFSGSVNFYAQPKGFFLPYGGREYNSIKADPAKDATMLEGYKDNKYDTAFTLGGPIIKDKCWFFVSGQYRKDKNTFSLSRSASSTQENVDYLNSRTGLFGKLTFRPTQSDSFTLEYFLDDRTREGDRDKNIIKSQEQKEDFNIGVYSLYYQKVLSENLFFDFRYGHYWWNWTRGSRYPEAGVPDSLYFLPGQYPSIENYTFGGFNGEGRDDKNTRDQLSVNVEWFTEDMRIKAGAMYTSEYDQDDRFYNFGEIRTSLDSSLQSQTLGELIAAGIFPQSEFTERLLPYMNNNWNATSTYFDSNQDGIVSADELKAATFNTANEHGMNFWRIMDSVTGANKVRAKRWAGYVMDDWKISDFLTLNAGLRMENHRYRDSEDGVIKNMDFVFLPRIGLAWDIGGQGKQKLTAFYGHFSAPMPFDMIHFAGNISGRVTNEQMFLNNDWYTYRVRGSAEVRDCVWTPNTKDSLSKEFSLTHEVELGKGFILASQAYYREDRNIIEDYDLFTYVNHYAGDPVWGALALTYADFGYPPDGPPGGANYFLSNLLGAKRNIYGIDFELTKRFKNGSYVVGQYSFKHAVGNSQSDGDADLQGDFIELDPRNDWMWGPTPGTIPHKIKLFGIWKTPIGLDIGAMIYWNSGWIYTESTNFMPGRYSIYYNYPLNSNSTQLVKTGQEKTPAFYQVDLKFNYTLKLTGKVNLDLFLDIYNVTNNQAPFDVQYAHDSKNWKYQETTEILLPSRLYLGARIRF